MNKFSCSCGTCGNTQEILSIVWSRLVSENKTCPRCESTEKELDNAVQKLKELLAPMGIQVVFNKTELTPEEFNKNPMQSNLILFNGRSLESLIGAQTGKSQCCDVCGNKECRTVKIEEESHETIPADIIVKAGLVAAFRVDK